MGCYRIDSTLINCDYLSFFFKTNEYRAHIDISLSGSSINNLKPLDIESLEIFLPPLSEQTAIAEVLSDMDSEIEALEKKLNKYKKVKQGMMQELLTGKKRLI